MNILNKFIVHFFLKATSIKVGSDQFGNIYYESKKVSQNTGRKKRSCFYNGIVEASKIPDQWFLWLHYTTNGIPPKNKVTHNINKHLPNLTGTKYANLFAPSGNVRKKNTYIAWEAPN